MSTIRLPMPTIPANVLRASLAAVLRDSARRSEIAADLLHRAATALEAHQSYEALLSQAAEVVYEISRGIGTARPSPCVGGEEVEEVKASSRTT